MVNIAIQFSRAQRSTIKRSQHDQAATQRMRFVDALKLWHANDQNQPVAAIDFPCECSSSATRLHFFVICGSLQAPMRLSAIQSTPDRLQFCSLSSPVASDNSFRTNRNKIRPARFAAIRQRTLAFCDSNHRSGRLQNQEPLRSITSLATTTRRQHWFKFRVQLLHQTTPKKQRGLRP